MYVNITGSANNKDVYIYQSYRKENGKTSSRIYRKLGKFNDLLARFDGDKDKMMAWAKEEAAKDTAAYNEQKEKVSVEFSPTARIPLDEEGNFNSGYLCLQKLCSELRIDIKSERQTVCIHEKSHGHDRVGSVFFAFAIFPASAFLFGLEVVVGAIVVQDLRVPVM